MIYDSRPTRWWKIVESIKSWSPTESKNVTPIFVCFKVLVKQSRAKAVNSQNFWDRLHTKMELFCLFFFTQKVTWQPNYTIVTSSIKEILKAMTNTICFGTNFRGGLNFFLWLKFSKQETVLIWDYSAKITLRLSFPSFLSSFCWSHFELHHGFKQKVIFVWDKSEAKLKYKYMLNLNTSFAT